MSKHVADQNRDRTLALRAREYARIEREHGTGGPHHSTRSLQNRAAEAPAPGARVREFVRRERSQRG